MFLKRILDILIKAGAIIIILEPLWMLLPFAGFLYSSVLNLEFLKNSCYTIWLLYFIFPTQTLSPVAYILKFAGLAIFIIGACQVYSAKIRKSGLVKAGVYKKFRHPQYTGLILLAIGFVLSWGRIIAYIAIFLMIYIYYYLSKKEEGICLDTFGKEYENYMERTYFLLPGEKIFSSVIGRPFSSLTPKKWARPIVSFVLLMSIGITVCFGILSIRDCIVKVGFDRAKISITPDREINLIMIRGIKRHMIRRFTLQKRGMNEKNDDEFYNWLLSLLVSSEKMRNALKMVDSERLNNLLCFFISRKVREWKPYYRKGKGDVFVMLVDSRIQLKSDNLNEFRNGWNVLGAMEINEFDMSAASLKDEPVKGEIQIHKPFLGESYGNFQRRIESILNIYLSGSKTDTAPAK